MADEKINSMIAGGTNNTIENFSVSPEDTKGASGNGESRFQNNEWTQQLAYLKKIPEIKKAIWARAVWTIGKGYTTDPQTEMLLDTIKGNGKDTFTKILKNMWVTKRTGGDSYAEIIRDDEGNLINIKPLNPGIIVVVQNEQGIIIRYEQMSRTNKYPTKFKPEQIFHLSNDRIADEGLGTSDIEAVEEIIKTRNEATTDYREVLHDNVRPRWKFKLKTDDPTEIEAYKAKMDAVTKTKSANIYEPFDVSESELISVPPNATLDPKAWIQDQNGYYYQTVGTPQIIVGGSGEFTEATAKIVYIAWEQDVADDQLELKEEVLSQLNLIIEPIKPASIENELLSDNAKDGAENIQPNETTAGSGQ